MLVKAWLDEGGHSQPARTTRSDSTSRFRTVWGMVTRETAAVGVRDPSTLSIATRHSSFAPHPVHSCIGDSSLLGPPEIGKLADIVAFRKDSLTWDIEELPDLRPISL